MNEGWGNHFFIIYNDFNHHKRIQSSVVHCQKSMQQMANSLNASCVPLCSHTVHICIALNFYVADLTQMKHIQNIISTEYLHWAINLFAISFNSRYTVVTRVCSCLYPYRPKFSNGACTAHRTDLRTQADMHINLRPNTGNLFHCGNHISCSSHVSVLEPELQGSVGK